jgi:S1-C subfamily serine protease
MKQIFFTLYVIICLNLVATDAYLGIRIANPTSSELRNANLQAGIKIESIVPTSPAELYGLMPNDIIFQMNNNQITSQDDLQRFMHAASPHTIVHVHLVQNGRRNIRQVQLTNRESVIRSLYIYNYIHNPILFIGFDVEQVTASLARLLNLETGMVVSEVRENSIAERQGLDPGDIIISINGKSTHDRESLTRALNMSLDDQPMKLSVWRNSESMTLSLDLSMTPENLNPALNNLFILGPDIFDNELYAYSKEMINRLINMPRNQIEEELDRLMNEVERLRKRMGQE